MTKKLIEPTPGEWAVDPRGWIISKDPEISPSKWDIAEIIGGFTTLYEAKANAKMMAASKKMHKALKEATAALNKFAKMDEKSYGELDFSYEISLINQAIEAAELWVDDE